MVRKCQKVGSHLREKLASKPLLFYSRTLPQILLEEQSHGRMMTFTLLFKNTCFGGHLGGLLVKHPMVDFSSGHGPRDVRSSPVLSSMLGVESA